VSQVDSLLSKFQNREDELFKALEKRYADVIKKNAKDSDLFGDPFG